MPLLPASPTVAPLTFKRRVLAIFAGLVAANLLAWAWAFSAFHDYPLLLGTAFWPIASACAMPWMPTTSPPSTTPPAS
jgi:hypothetical protein